MLKDAYGNEITVRSDAARDLYVEAVDRLLSGAADMVAGFEAVVAEDPACALAHSGLARAYQISWRLGDAKQAMARAIALIDRVSTREAAHLQAMDLLLSGRLPEAYRAIRAHVAEHPRDVMMAQICTSVYGLIGFSGQPGREAELLAYTSFLLPFYGEDWWCLSQQAFSLCETGQLERAGEMVERSLALNPANAHAAHVRSHCHYERGEIAAGRSFLADWLTRYDRRALLHGHLSWHVALWDLEQGDSETMWRSFDADIGTESALGIPLIVLTDAVSLLYRAALAGLPVPQQRWLTVSAYAERHFPKPALGFADLHVVIAHAMAGRTEALNARIEQPVGPAADLVRLYAQAFGAIAEEKWELASALLVSGMSDHARIGGSRAQRDLLELSLLDTLLKQGRKEEARRLLALRRPALVDSQPVAGL